MRRYSKNGVNVVLAVASAAVLVACGGGGGGTDSAGASLQGGTTPTAISGMVSDGAIQGATVFLDLNTNQTQDAGEPVSADTAADGSFKIDTSSLSAAQIKAGHLVALVPSTAKDADDAGQTLAAAGKAPFTLMAPAAAYVAADGSVNGAVVSPITTLVSHDMVSDGSKSLAAATATVQSRLGLSSSTSLTQDPSKSATLKTTAQVIAAALGQVNKLAKDASTAANSVSDREALLAALTYVQQNAAALKKAVEDAAAAAPNNAKPKASDTVASLVGSSSTNTALKADTTALTNSAKQTTSSTVGSTAELLAAGSYSLQCLESCDSRGARFNKLSGTVSTWTEASYKRPGSDWETYTREERYVLTASGWAQKAARTGGAFAPDGTGGVVSADDGLQARVATRRQDVSGIKLSSIPGLNMTGEWGATVLPAGSVAYYTTMTDLADSYELSLGFVPGTYNGGAGFTSLFAMVDAAQTPAANQPVNPMGSNGLNFTFNELSSTSGPANAGTVTLYSCSLGTQAASSGCNGGAWNSSGATDYQFIRVQGQDILRINAPYGSNGKRLIFGVPNGKVMGGDFTPGNVLRNASVNLNKVAVNFVLSLASLPPVPN